METTAANKKTQLTFSEALKVYTGSSLSGSLLTMIGLSAGMVIFCIVFVYAIGMVAEGGNTDEIRSAFEANHSFNIMLAVFCGVQGSLLFAQSYEKGVPGGKYFRTVKGGFDSFKKVRIILNLEAVLMTAVFYTVVGLAACCSVITLRYGINFCVSAVLFTILGVEINNLLLMVRSIIKRSLFMMWQMIALSLAGIFILDFTDGRLCAVHIVIAVLDAVLMLVTNRIMLSYYKKNCWDN